MSENKLFIEGAMTEAYQRGEYRFPGDPPNRATESREADKEFLFTYYFGGKEWGTSLFAADEAEAKEKIKAQGMARLDGILVARIPAYGGLRADFLFDLICRVRNWLVRK